MDDANEPAEGNESALASELLELIGSSWKTQAILAAAELRIADFLTHQPHTADELAALVGAEAAALRQLLRALTTLGICRESADDRYCG